MNNQQGRQACHQCDFFKHEANECHRYPPQTIAFRRLRFGFLRLRSVLDAPTTFPRVDPKNWCGEFQCTVVKPPIQ